MTAAWNETVGSTEAAPNEAAPNEAVIWDTIITSPSADHLANLGKVAKRKLLESGKGKTVDTGRYVSLFPSSLCVWISVSRSCGGGYSAVSLDEEPVRGIM